MHRGLGTWWRREAVERGALAAAKGEGKWGLVAQV